MIGLLVVFVATLLFVLFYNPKPKAVTLPCYPDTVTVIEQRIRESDTMRDIQTVTHKVILWVPLPVAPHGPTQPCDTLR